MAIKNLNRVVLLGVLDAKPKCVTDSNQKAVCNFILRTSETWMGKDGPTTRTCRHHCLAYGPLAKTIREARVGGFVYVEGALRDDLDAAPGATTDVVLTFLVQPVAEPVPMPEAEPST